MYFVVINDLGKSQKMIEAINRKGIESVDYDLILKYLLKYNMLPSLDRFSDESKNSLISVLNNGVNMGLQEHESNISRVITRLSLMLRLSNPNDIKIVEHEILDNLDKYQELIYELNQSGYENQPAFLLYYSPAMLNNACTYFKNNNSESPIKDALKVCLPYMQSIIIEARLNMSNQGPGINTVLLRDVAMKVSENPFQLNELEIVYLGQNQACVQKKLKK